MKTAKLILSLILAACLAMPIAAQESVPASDNNDRIKKSLIKAGKIAFYTIETLNGAVILLAGVEFTKGMIEDYKNSTTDDVFEIDIWPASFFFASAALIGHGLHGLNKEIQPKELYAKLKERYFKKAAQEEATTLEAKQA